MSDPAAHPLCVDGDTEVTSLWTPDAPAGAMDTLVLAHGAGADMRHEFMQAMSARVAARGLRAVRFNFPYTEAGRRAPDRAPRLEQAWTACAAGIAARLGVGGAELILGGKSMGGRIASHVVAAGAPARGLVFLGYPLHPAGRPERLRFEHLAAVRCPMLFVQGTRDPLCDLAKLAPILADLAAPVTLEVVEGGDHSFGVLKRSGRDPEAVRDAIADVVAAWCAGLPGSDGVSRRRR